MMNSKFVEIGEQKRNEIGFVPFINAYCVDCRKHFEVNTKHIMLEEYDPIWNWYRMSMLCSCGMKIGSMRLPQTIRERDSITAYNREMDIKIRNYDEDAERWKRMRERERQLAPNHRG